MTTRQLWGVITVKIFEKNLVKLWQILKHFLDFKINKNFFYAWEYSDARNQNVNKFVGRISVGTLYGIMEFLILDFEGHSNNHTLSWEKVTCYRKTFNIKT